MLRPSPSALTNSRSASRRHSAEEAFQERSLAPAANHRACACRWLRLAPRLRRNQAAPMPMAGNLHCDPLANRQPREQRGDQRGFANTAAMSADYHQSPRARNIAADMQAETTVLDWHSFSAQKRYVSSRNPKRLDVADRRRASLPTLGRSRSIQSAKPSVGSERRFGYRKDSPAIARRFTHAPCRLKTGLGRDGMRPVMVPAASRPRLGDATASAAQLIPEDCRQRRGTTQLNDRKQIDFAAMLDRLDGSCIDHVFSRHQ